MDEDKQQPAPPPAGADDTKPAQSATGPADAPLKKKQPALPPPKPKSKPLALKALSAPSKPAAAARKPEEPQSTPAPQPTAATGEPPKPPVSPKPKVQLPKSPFAATKATPSSTPPATPAAPATTKKTIPVKYITSGVMVLAIVVLFVMNQTKKSRQARPAPPPVATQQAAPAQKNVKPAAAKAPSAASPTMKQAPAVPTKPVAAQEDRTTGKKPWVIEDLKLMLCWIPEGKALLGTAEGDRSDLKGRLPQNETHVLNYESEKESEIARGYWLGETEVTIGQWKAFIAANPEFKTAAEIKGSAYSVRDDGSIGAVSGANWRKPLTGGKVTERHPVTCIRPPEAENFCDWLTKREREAGRLPAGLAFRLPTETEWVHACRGGAQTRSAYWWGGDPAAGEGCLNAAGAEFTAQHPATEKFNFAWSDPHVHLAPVDAFGAKGRNAYGLADTLGNVWECVTQPLQTKYRYAWCGGSFAEGPGICRCASSRHRYTDNPSANAGFRVCLAPE